MSRVATAPSKQERMQETQAHLKEWMRNKINRNLTRNPFQRREIEARNLRTVSEDARFIRKPVAKPDPFHRHLQLAHRANPEGISVLNLPKQPFGSHKNYNDKMDFMKSHVVMKNEVLDTGKTKLLDEVIRKFRLSKKKNQNRFVTVKRGVRNRTGSLDMQKKEYDEFISGTCHLWCPREKQVEAAYDEQKSKYKSVDMEQSSDIINELLTQLRKNRPHPSSLPFQRLYLDSFRERRTTPMSTRLSVKYAELFGDFEQAHARRGGSIDLKATI